MVQAKRVNYGVVDYIIPFILPYELHVNAFAGVEHINFIVFDMDEWLAFFLALLAQGLNFIRIVAFVFISSHKWEYVFGLMGQNTKLRVPTYQTNNS